MLGVDPEFLHERLRNSGSIEQDADLVRPLVKQEYCADTEEEKDESKAKPI